MKHETFSKFAVIGAGFTGLAICAALKRNNIKFECIEEDSEVGGNWVIFYNFFFFLLKKFIFI